MLYIKISPTGLPLQIKEGHLSELELQDRSWTHRWDWKSYEMVVTLAKYVTAMTGNVFLPIDQGEHRGPRFDVMRAPAVGDEVSYGFNGDYYPDGTITKISKTWIITTSTGKTYRRRDQTSGWYQPGGTWRLVAGHVDERNPHF